jgi:hypothetical protein
MDEARVKTGLWVQAQIRLCDIESIPVVVVHRGDADAGAVLLKMNRLGDGCEVLTRFRGLDGEQGWLRGTGPDPVAEPEADDYIRRQIDRDPDVWVVEIEDPRGRYPLDGPIS